MKAVIIKERGKPALAEIKEPAMRPGYVKVKTAAVAINPSELNCPQTY
jgi:NADPH:quinone reductase-like Zn-dependent oxidoreductase